MIENDHCDGGHESKICRKAKLIDGVTSSKVGLRKVGFPREQKPARMLHCF